MATLKTSLYGGKSSRLVDVFRDRPIDVGGTYYAGAYGLSITMGGTEWRKDRSYHLTLSPADLGKVVDRLIMPLRNLTLGSISERTSEPALFDNMLAERGIFLEKYRYPATPFADGTERWYWYRAVNRAHAEHQFKNLFKAFDPSLLERIDD